MLISVAWTHHHDMSRLRQVARPAAKHAVAHCCLAQHRSVVAMHGERVLVYNGEGAGSRSVLSAAETLRSSLRASVQVGTAAGALANPGPCSMHTPPACPACMQVAQMGPEELLAGDWRSSCLMLVMPGGADLPYCRQLNGLGNELIRGAQTC